MQDDGSLRSLYTALVDARNGYREAVRYDEAIAAARGDVALIGTLERQRETLLAKIDMMNRAAERA